MAIQLTEQRVIEPRPSGHPLEAQTQRTKAASIFGALFFCPELIIMISLYDAATMKAALLLPLDPPFAACCPIAFRMPLPAGWKD
ncbi:hypothetical protein K7W03_24390 [Sphingobium sp. PNB]|uniref:hypothetical protein n=1 Tax=Sphingobium sp. PNB TaxID=863934 RepID=UPI001CA3FC9E|nr:hypothetical protein [Sphingobium sp. PNB]MCB4862730.1 hypothetical protein [Sphingobium sp. PNB]